MLLLFPIADIILVTVMIFFNLNSLTKKQLLRSFLYPEEVVFIRIDFYYFYKRITNLTTSSGRYDGFYDVFVKILLSFVFPLFFYYIGKLLVVNRLGFDIFSRPVSFCCAFLVYYIVNHFSDKVCCSKIESYTKSF